MNRRGGRDLARPPWWVVTRGTVVAIAEREPEAAAAAFRGPTAVVLEGWPGAVTGRAWASADRFASDAGEGSIPPEVRAVMYDPEGWEATPLAERLDPLPHIRRFAGLAEELGYLSIVTPHAGLTEVPGGRLSRRPEESKEQAYVRMGVAREAARGADVYETQAQRLQNDPRGYREYVARTAEQARAANPEVVVLSGLSTHPGYAATPAMLFEARRSVRDVVDGHYLSVPVRRVGSGVVERLWDVAARFVRLVVEAEGA